MYPVYDATDGAIMLHQLRVEPDVTGFAMSGDPEPPPGAFPDIPVYKPDEPLKPPPGAFPDVPVQTPQAEPLPPAVPWPPDGPVPA